jgi:hypothetical protein
VLDTSAQREDEVTIGIGAVAEGGSWVVMGSDLRASWPKTAKVGPNDSAGKQWDLPRPFDCAVCVAGVLSVAQLFVSELASQLEKLGEMAVIYGEHVEHAIQDSRFRTQRSRVDWELRKSYCITLDQWLTGKIPGGKMHKLIVKAGEAVIDGTPLPLEVLLGGFVQGRLLFYKASGKYNLELGSSPAVFVVGTGGQLAMDVLNRRGQHVDCSLPRTILHVAEALEAAEKEPGGTVGKAKILTVIHEKDGMGQFTLDNDLIQEWKRLYADRPSTQALQDNAIARAQITQRFLLHVRRGETPRRRTKTPTSSEPQR